MGIEVTRLCKAYGGNKVLDGFSCAFPVGAVTCIVGPSGVGKTTLLRIMMGLEPPDSGAVSGLDGKRFSAVFQDDRLCENLSALSNVWMVCRDIRSRADVREALAEVGLGGHEEKPARELSGGMRRRVAVARALMTEYDVLFLDEAFKGLDAEAKAALIDLVKLRSEGKTVLMVTHETAEAEAMGAGVIELWPPPEGAVEKTP